MNKNIKILGLTILSIIILTGCGNFKNGISVPGEDVYKKNAQTKFYIDKNATYKYEKQFLEQLQNELKSGATIKDYYQLTIKDIEEQKLDILQLNMFMKSNILIPEQYKLKNNDTQFQHVKKNKNIKFSTVLINHGLEIKNNYSSKIDALNDYLTISQYLIDNEEFRKKYGYTALYVDINALSQNKLVLKSILPLVDFTQELEKQLEIRGFTLVNDPTKSTKIIVLENPLLLKKKYVGDVKRRQSDIEQYFNALKSSAGDIGQLGMNFANSTGSSNTASANLGLALFALNYILGSPSEEDFVDTWVINILEANNPSDYSQAILRLEADNINYKMRKREKELKAKRTIYFIELGDPYYKGDMAIKRSSNHEFVRKTMVSLP